jgi:CheY-like chemotaxis protein
VARILVVDDSQVDLQLARKLLEKMPNWTVSTARNGKEGLERIESELPDLVVTDLQMPEMNGLELVETLRNEYPLIPVILMTAAGSESIAVEALQKGAASYVPKRELAADLADIVSRVLASATKQRNRRRLLNYMTEVTYVLENDLDLISSLVSDIRELIQERWLFDETECLRMATAIDEALCNAFYHGNLEVSSDLREQDANAYHDLAKQRRLEEPYRSRRIHVRLRLDRQEVSVTIRDEGPGFDPDSLPDPTAPGYLERPCGRGVLLMRAFTDEVAFNSTGNEVTLRKQTRHVDGSTVLDDGPGVAVDHSA